MRIYAPPRIVMRCGIRTTFGRSGRVTILLDCAVRAVWPTGIIVARPADRGGRAVGAVAVAVLARWPVLVEGGSAGSARG
jgi:hypothetical protein